MIEQIFLTSLFTTGLYITTHEPYLLAWFREFVAMKVLKATYHWNPIEETGTYIVTGWQWYVWKPLLGCLPCMASVWGFALYTLSYPLSVHSLYELPIIILGASGVNYAISRIILKDKV